MSCPICKSAPQPNYRPFCSKRCADLDLSKWLNGDYALPASDDDQSSDRVDAAQSSQPPLH